MVLLHWVWLIANSIFFHRLKKRIIQPTLAKPSLLSFLVRKWVKARTKINWHCILLHCLLLLHSFFHHHHPLVRCPIDHFDYQQIISYVLVSSTSMRRAFFFLTDVSLFVKDQIYLHGSKKKTNINRILFILENDLLLYKDDMAVKNGSSGKENLVISRFDQLEFV